MNWCKHEDREEESFVAVTLTSLNSVGQSHEKWTYEVFLYLIIIYIWLYFIHWFSKAAHIRFKRAKQADFYNPWAILRPALAIPMLINKIASCLMYIYTAFGQSVPNIDSFFFSYILTDREKKTINAILGSLTPDTSNKS